MAHRRSSLKKIRVDKRRHEINRRTISELRGVARQVAASLTAKKADEASRLSGELFSKLDKAVKKGILHKNTVSRKKSRIQLKINSLKTKA